MEDKEYTYSIRFRPDEREFVEDVRGAMHEPSIADSIRRMFVERAEQFGIAVPEAFGRRRVRRPGRRPSKKVAA